jgi:hypothetical protein
MSFFQLVIIAQVLLNLRIITLSPTADDALSQPTVVGTAQEPIQPSSEASMNFPTKSVLLFLALPMHSLFAADQLRCAWLPLTKMGVQTSRLLVLTYPRPRLEKELNQLHHRGSSLVAGFHQQNQKDEHLWKSRKESSLLPNLPQKYRPLHRHLLRDTQIMKGRREGPALLCETIMITA